MKRIGILGGTFDPVHIGHLAIAQTARDKLRLDRVVFVPSCLPPHKTARGVAPAKHRLAMVKLAVDGNKDFEVSEFEVKRPGKSYSVDTVRHFYETYPLDTKFFFLIGADALPTLPQWKDIDQLATMVAFVVINRPGYEGESPIKHKSITMPGLDVSSSYIRKLLSQGKQVKYLVPEKVEAYLSKHKLYTSKV